MSKKDDALKLALEYRPTMDKEVLHSWATEMKKAVQEAQAEQAQQNPFGFIKPGEGDYEKVFSWNRNERNGYTQAVYTSPQPAQRTWVGLTDEEVDDLSREMVKGNKSVNWLAQAIEAKIKEKNNG